MYQEGREPTCVENTVDASMQRLEDYIEKCGGRLITATRNSSDNTRINPRKITRKLKWEEKQLYGRFERQIRENLDVVKKRNLKKETESLLIAAPNNAIKTNYIKARIDKMQ